jgi:hypothetical protein
MKQGELDNAIRRALNLFDAWNDVTGAVHKHTSIYYEIQSLIEDAVHCGAQAATGDYHPLDGERDYTQPRTHHENANDETKGSSYVGPNP